LKDKWLQKIGKTYLALICCMLLHVWQISWKNIDHRPRDTIQQSGQ
jgi:hypothetical protein